MNEPRNNRANVILDRLGMGYDSIKYSGVRKLRAWFAQLDIDVLLAVERTRNLPWDGKRMCVVHRIVIGDAGFSRMHIGTAQIFRGDNLAGGGLHQRRTTKKDRALLAYDNGLEIGRAHV